MERPSRRKRYDSEQRLPQMFMFVYRMKDWAYIPPLLIAFLFFTFNTQALSQTSIELDQALTGAARGATSGAHYHYLFENPRFTTPVQELEFDGSGQGKFRFKRKDSDEIVNKLSVSTEVLSQIQLLLDDMNFLDRKSVV